MFVNQLGRDEAREEQQSIIVDIEETVSVSIGL